MRIAKWVGLGLVVVLLIGTAGFVYWANDSLQPMPEALAAMQSDASVQVQTQPWLVFKPVEGEPTTGFIFYPGGKVDPRAYAPMARALAERGHLAVIVPMPLNLAIFGGSRASDVVRAYPEIQHWAIGGHSLGGVAAASFALNHRDEIDGLVLLASYPADSDNLAETNLQVVSIGGTQDLLSTPEKIAASRARLPGTTEFLEIPGGNHAQMGWYGMQPGDGTAAISRQAQQNEVLAAIANLLGRMRAATNHFRHESEWHQA